MLANRAPGKEESLLSYSLRRSKPDIVSRTRGYANHSLSYSLRRSKPDIVSRTRGLRESLVGSVGSLFSQTLDELRQVRRKRHLHQQRLARGRVHEAQLG